MDLSATGDYSRSLVGVEPASGEASARLAADDRRALIQAVRAVNKAEVFGQEHELSFAVDRATRRPVVRIVDRKTRQVVEQIPSESVLRLAEDLKKS